MGVFMIKFKRIIISIFALVFLASCGPKETNSTNAKEDQDRAALRSTLGQFAGTYKGAVTPTTGDPRPINVEIQLRIEDIADGGTNDSREVTFHPELRGFFFRPDLASQPISHRPVRMRYYRERGEFALDNTDTIVSPTPNNGVVRMSGTIRDGVIDGPISFTIGDTITGNLYAVRQ
jgi:hypothetical protein